MTRPDFFVFEQSGLIVLRYLLESFSHSFSFSFFFFFSLDSFFPGLLLRLFVECSTHIYGPHCKQFKRSQ